MHFTTQTGRGTVAAEPSGICVYAAEHQEPQSNFPRSKFNSFQSHLLSLLLPNHEMNAFNLGFETSVIEKPDCYGTTRSFNVFFPIRKKATLTGERLLVFVFVMSLITLLLFA